jgi:hypothetical protein
MIFADVDCDYRLELRCGVQHEHGAVGRCEGLNVEWSEQEQEQADFCEAIASRLSADGKSFNLMYYRLPICGNLSISSSESTCHTWAMDRRQKRQMFGRGLPFLSNLQISGAFQYIERQIEFNVAS